MTQLLERFDEIFDTPESVDNLRVLILDMAVHGKLVSQDPNDEPASCLLRRIKEDKERLIKEGKIKKQKSLDDIRDDEKPYELPKGWEWVRLGSIISKLGAGSTPAGGKKVYQDSGIKFIRSQNVWNHSLALDGIAYISKDIHSNMANSKVKPKDILLNITGASIGRSCIVPDDFDEGNVNQHVTIVRLVDDSFRSYIHKTFISPFFQKLIMDVQVGVSREGLSISKLSLFPIPVPPLAEQKRIIARVNQLMQFCDQLQARLEQKQKNEEKLHSSIFSSLEQAKTEEELQQHLEYALSNFYLLCNDTKYIKHLRNVILSLAVRGKLVTQDLRDEPASNLLAQIKAEKDRLMKEGKIKKQKPLVDIREDEKLYELPEGWKWVRFGQLAETSGGKTPSMSKQEYWKDGTIPWVTPKDMKFNYITDTMVKMSSVGSATTKIFPPNTLLTVVRSGILQRRLPTAILNVEATINQDLKASMFHNSEIVDFIFLVFRAFEKSILSRFSKKGTTVESVNFDLVQQMAIPIPPLMEQKRIISKVNQLMHLCDQLEQQIDRLKQSQRQLMGSALQAILEGKNEAVLAC